MRLEINNSESVKTECIKEVKEYIEKYIDKLPSLKNDLKNLNLIN